MIRSSLFVLFCLLYASVAQAQSAALNKAKYVTVLKVILDHKMNDAELEPDVAKLRESERFKKELVKMIGKLDNSRPSEAKNRRIMRILERTGKEIYGISNYISDWHAQIGVTKKRLGPPGKPHWTKRTLLLNQRKQIIRRQCTCTRFMHRTRQRGQSTSCHTRNAIVCWKRPKTKSPS